LGLRCVLGSIFNAEPQSRRAAEGFLGGTSSLALGGCGCVGFELLAVALHRELVAWDGEESCKPEGLRAGARNK